MERSCPLEGGAMGGSDVVPGGAEPLDGEEYLDIIGIMRNQAGRYECKASNDVATPDVKYVNANPGRERDISRFDCNPLVSMVTLKYRHPPTIKKTQSSETPVGRVGTLQCEATAVPTPEFEWYRDEKRLSNAQGVNIQILGTTTVLMIANVTEEDYGNYTCVASNRLGVQNASLFLYSEYGRRRHRGYTTQRTSLKTVTRVI
ncbi:Limbic system-associated membrane protein [Liparis tanakae]|uniref:Limbic system-associated membrane protein n=1 Tax=Liparis tanakae TaxID=230148 RepID=A0A4Z2G1A8_9TELE|nr:Limbic system-associated membrane protein [Liparis tanakae]